MKPKYTPINCSFYDELTAFALAHKKCEIVYKMPMGEEVRVFDTITDVLTRDQEEYLILASGTEIRLDRLMSVDGKPISPACNS